MNSQKNLDISIEFNDLLKRVRQGQFFALSRFGDGEICVIQDGVFRCAQWQMTAQEASAFRDALVASLCYQHPDYMIGIPCSCRENIDGYRAYLEKNFDLSASRLTFGSLFVNAMYRRVQSELLPAFKSYPIILVANAQSDLTYFSAQGFRVI